MNELSKDKVLKRLQEEVETGEIHVASFCDFLKIEIESGALDAPSEWNACLDAVLEKLGETDEEYNIYNVSDSHLHAEKAIESLRRKEQEASE